MLDVPTDFAALKDDLSRNMRKKLSSAERN